MTSRRRFLKLAGTSASAIALAGFPPSIRRALAIPANNTTGTIGDVEHVVILMQENRSFDQYFGTLRGVRGFGDRFTVPLPNGRSVWQQSDSAGHPVLPYHLDGGRSNAQRARGTPHSWIDSQNAWDNGRMDQWPRAKGVNSMGYFQEPEIPFQFALADAFTVCDAYHCAIHTGTHANRMFHWTGTNGPTGADVAFVNNYEPWFKNGPSAEGYKWKTYPERLEEAGIRWMIYQNIPNNSAGFNPLMGFEPYRRANENSSKPIDALRKGFLGAPAYQHNDAVSNPYYKGIGNTLPVADQAALDAGDCFATFRDDVQSGRLPQVSWILPLEPYCEHPGPSSPVQGAWFVQQVLDILTSAPDVWSKTVLIVNFDENDGYFDHMPPPAAPSLNPDHSLAGGTTLSEADMRYEYFTHPRPPGMPDNQPQPDGRVYGPGVRVPMFVISPWSRGGWVNSEVFDHTSVIRFLEARFNVYEPNISPFRRAVCGDLTTAFNFAQPNDEMLPTLGGRRTKAQADTLRAEQQALPQMVPPANPQLPQQARGMRPSRALPYELHVQATADPATYSVQLAFRNTGTAGTVFHVYDRLHLDRPPRRYLIEAGKELAGNWDLKADTGKYDLWVLGPNGFHRHVTGNTTASFAEGKARPEVQVGYDRQARSLSIALANTGGATCVFLLRANAYETWSTRVSVAAGKQTTVTRSLKFLANWYDITATVESDALFARRFAGRMETGLHGVSDPAMGIV